MYFIIYKVKQQKYIPKNMYGWRFCVITGGNIKSSNQNIIYYVIAGNGTYF